MPLLEETLVKQIDHNPEAYVCLWLPFQVVKWPANVLSDSVLNNL